MQPLFLAPASTLKPEELSMFQEAGRPRRGRWHGIGRLECADGGRAAVGWGSEATSSQTTQLTPLEDGTQQI